MTPRKILVTGGAGFIGSFLVDRLVENGHRVRVLDVLDPQIHVTGEKFAYRNPDAEYTFGDLRNKQVVEKCLQDVEVVFHQASAVGVSQSQEKIEHYVDVNIRGTATLYQALIDQRKDLYRMVVAGSISSYGEGAYQCVCCGPCLADKRPLEQLDQKHWDPRCPKCRTPLKPVPTTEEHPRCPHSIYGLSKSVQEDLAANMAMAYGFPTVVLRYFNAYGPRQALGNPYTGVLAIFINRLLNNHTPVIYEDGHQLRDFVSVHDLVSANLLAMDSPLDFKGGYFVFNVGSGAEVSIRAVAEMLARKLRKDIQPQMLGKYRVGDIRHSFADITKARKILGYQPKHDLEQNITEIIDWAQTETPPVDQVDQVIAGFSKKRLVR